MLNDESKGRSVNEIDVLTLLMYCNELDGRHAPNEIKVQAWYDVLVQGAPDMSLSFAREAARRHYSMLDVMITPSTFIRAWTKSVRAQEAVLTDGEAHCQRGGCMCTHTSPCFRGWVDLVDGTTSPCLTCRGSLAAVIAEIPPLGKRKEMDYARIRNRYNVS